MSAASTSSLVQLQSSIAEAQQQTTMVPPPPAPSSSLTVAGPPSSAQTTGPSAGVYSTAMLTLTAAAPNQNLNVITAPIVVDISNFTVNCITQTQQPAAAAHQQQQQQQQPSISYDNNVN